MNAKNNGSSFALFLLLSILGLLSSGCATQDDGDVIFSDTERSIINTLIYTEPDDDPTNAYDQNSAAATLGQKFFWDTQFSGGIILQGDRTSTYAAGTTKLISCASCHSPSHGWADSDSKPNNVSLGANFTSRNTPTILNSVRNSYMLWDGSVDTPWGVARAAGEGAPHNFGRVGVAFIICQNATYKAQYEAIFGTTETTAICGTIATSYCGGSCVPTAANNYSRNLYTGSVVTDGYVDRIFVNFSKAIAAYERLIVSKNSPFDQWAQGNESAMTAQEKRGLKIFITKGNCVRCHSGPNFADGSFHNLGVPQIGGYSGSNDLGRYSGISTLVSGANAVYNTSTSYNDDSSVNRVSNLAASDSDQGRFRVPTLRSVSQTAPYFHNGTFISLWDVVNFYNFAGGAGNFPGTKDTVLTTRRMTNDEMEDLVAFLKALDGEDLSSTLTTSPGGFGTTTGW